MYMATLCLAPSVCWFRDARAGVLGRGVRSHANRNAAGLRECLNVAVATIFQCVLRTYGRENGTTKEFPSAGGAAVNCSRRPLLSNYSRTIKQAYLSNEE